MRFSLQSNSNCRLIRIVSVGNDSIVRQFPHFDVIARSEDRRWIYITRTSRALAGLVQAAAAPVLLKPSSTNTKTIRMGALAFSVERQLLMVILC